MEYPDPTGIETWPSAVVAIFIIVAVAVIPSLFAYLNNRLAREVRNTLTTNNGGSTVKDSLDRIEGHLENVDTRLTRLEEGHPSADSSDV